MIGLTKLSLRRPVSVFMVVLALFIFGMSAMATTPLELIPQLEMPMMMVMTIYPNAAPQDVETLVTSKLEDAASTVANVKNIQSVSLENVSMIILEFNYGTDMDEARSGLRNNIEMYTMSLPEEVKRPTILEMRTDMMSTISISATAKGDVDLLTYVNEYVKPEIEKLGEVATVEVTGGNEDYISITLKEEALSQYKLDMNTIVQIISNADFSLPAGNIGQGDLNLILRGGVSYPTTESLNSIPITLPTGDIIRLSDVATVYEAANEPTSISRVNGVQNVVLDIFKRQNSSTLTVTDSVKSVVDKINAQGLGVDLRVHYDSSEMILNTINTVVQTMLYSIALAMLVLFVFFGDWRASLIVGSSIPMSLLVTLVAMQFMGFTFNMLSLGGLVIGIGMMVDNSIVVLESCFRSKTANRTMREAAIEGSRTVASSIFASTLTTVVVFLPIPFIKGMTGQMFSELCFTIVFSLVASLLSAVTLVPLIYYRLSPQEKEYKTVHNIMSKLENAYAAFLPKTLAHKGLVVLTAVLLLGGSISLIPLVGVEIFPATDEGTINLSINTRPGLKLEKLDEKIIPIEAIVSGHPDVDRYSVSAGGSGVMGSMMGGGGSATVTAYLKSNRATPTREVVDLWREQTKDIPDCDISITASSTTAQLSGGGGIDIPLQSAVYEDLVAASAQVETMLRQNPDILRVSSSITAGNPQAELVVDPIKSGAVGLLPKQVMGTVYSIMEGSQAASLNKDDRDYPVRVEYPHERFSSVSDLVGMSIKNPMGMSVPLMDIATITYSNSPQSITRLNGRYLVTVSGQQSSTASTKLGAEMNEKAKALVLPDGVTVGASAAMESQAEEFASLFGAIATAAFLVFMVMAMQFESPRFSLVVMLCVPFSMIGSFGALLLGGATVSLPSLMGFLMLVGIVVNNGILFIDTANRLRLEENLGPEEALSQSGKLRMRPILMTTLTTILAMIPMGMGVGENGALMQGMALVIMGGLVTSTILALLLLPSFYMLMDKKHVRKSRFKKTAKPIKQN